MSSLGLPLGLPWRSKKSKKSKSMTDLSSRSVVVALSSSQKSILANALTAPAGRSSPNKERLTNSYSLGLPKTDSMKRPRLTPQRCSENNLAYLAVTPDRVSLASQDSMNQLSNSVGSEQYRSLRKCHSSVENSNMPSLAKMHEGSLKKRDLKRFQKIFTPVIGEDIFYDCFSCALYQDSIASGYLYLTYNWFCFYSNFMGRHRQVAIDVNKIQSISQERTAKIIPNAIKITTDNEIFVFSSFISRDRAYKALVSLWNRTEEPQVSGESDDLSDVESMTRIVALTDYGSHSGSHINRPSETEDTSSELSNTGTELNIAQADSTSDVIEFVANPSSASIDIDSVTEEQVTSSQPSPSKVEETRCPDKELPVNSSKLQCKQMVLWQKVERSLGGLQSVLQWCYNNSTGLFGETHRFYNLLIICTCILAVMTFYLGLRMFTFEQEQITTLIARQLRMREHSIAHQFESTIDLNHKLVSQLSEILSAVQKLVHETKTACRHTKYPQ